MTNFSAQFGQSSGSDPKFVIPVYASTTITIPYDMDVKITAIGAGGSGGLIQGNASGVFASGFGGSASGGGPGSNVVKKTRLLAGTILTINIGAAGAAIISGTTNAVSSDGNDGGDTTVTGTGVAITAVGGKKGKATAGNVACSGGLAGIGSGGDLNLSGGRGGNIVATTGAKVARASGGGAVNVGLGAFNGGDINTLFTAATDLAIASGGGGIFSAAEIISASQAINYSGYSGGTGLLANSPSLTLPDMRRLFDLYPTIGPGAQNGSANGGATSNPGIGTGSAGDYGSTGSNNYAGPSGQFAGQGGAANAQGTNSNVGAINNVQQTNFGGGPNGSGGGGGGGSASKWGVATNSSGKGQAGLVILELY